MAFLAGVFSLYTPGNPVVSGTTISSAWGNNTLNDVATGLSTCVLKDGTQTMTAALPMASFRITGLGAGTAVTDAARVSQVQNSSFTYLTSVGGTVDVITATATPTPAAYVVGQQFTFIPAGANTTAVTLNIGGLGAGAVQIGGVALAGGELSASYPVTVVVSAATPVFQLVGGIAKLTNSLSGDVSLSNTGTYFVGPTVAQGTVGTWLATGSVGLVDTAGAANIRVKLWDGTTVIASATIFLGALNVFQSVSVSGYITSPAGNIRISCKDVSSTSGLIAYNTTGESKDATLSVVRIA